MFQYCRIVAFAAISLCTGALAQVLPGDLVEPLARHVPRPNFVFIMADDLGWGDLDCYGHRKIRTPSIDELADEGTLFTNYRNVAAVCSPTRASVLTGMFPATIAVHDVYGPPERMQAIGQSLWLPPVGTLPQALKPLGYVTGHFGKWHLGWRDGAPLLDAYGFDEHRSTLSSPDNPHYQSGRPTWPAQSSDLIVDDAIAFLVAHAGTPFYLQVSLAHPHSPLDSDPSQVEPYTDLAADTVNGWTNPQVNYYAAVTAMDGAVGRLLSAIDDLGLYGNTYVVFVSDNGPESMFNAGTGQSAEGSAGPFRGRKGSLYEGGVRSPCIVRGPGVPVGLISEAPLASVDWLPTFTAMAGSPQEAHGEDVTRALFGLSWTRSKAVLSEWRFGPRIPQQARLDASPGASIVVWPWKLLRNRSGSRTELYNLVTDTMEVDNIAAAYPSVVADLSAQILAWQTTLPPCTGCEDEGDNSYPWPR